MRRSKIRSWELHAKLRRGHHRHTFVWRESSSVQASTRSMWVLFYGDVQRGVRLRHENREEILFSFICFVENYRNVLNWCTMENLHCRCIPIRDKVAQQSRFLFADAIKPILRHDAAFMDERCCFWSVTVACSYVKLFGGNNLRNSLISVEYQLKVFWCLNFQKKKTYRIYLPMVRVCVSNWNKRFVKELPMAVSRSLARKNIRN